MERGVYRVDMLSSSSPNPCSICLYPLVQETYLDTCLHKFCYDCIVNWLKSVASKQHDIPSLKCPLCKRENYSMFILYGNAGHQMRLNQILKNSFFSEAHKFRLQCYCLDPGDVDNDRVLEYWKIHRYPKPNRWLSSWLRRELQALLQEEDVDIIQHHVLGVVDSISKRMAEFPEKREASIRQEEFKTVLTEAVTPFLGAHSDRFVTELERFVVLGLNVEAYDEAYIRRMKLNSSGVQVAEIYDSVRYEWGFFDEDFDGID